ncbi:MAG: nicotinate-nucleotide adenylyltransferase [Rhodospirillaceae bacterium]|nr:nicotinate-nucleotide adenylyltransferase [Rhodospirillaceae bacterium]MBT7360526.1 nicotinate-nucleotide adenylyltransferase [Rhodospirillaceae bacterium]
MATSGKQVRRSGSFRHRGRRIGLLGGSFNPAHDGHRHISQLALARLGLDEVWWLVSPQNPLKSEAGMAPFESRLESADRIACDRRIRVSALEAELGTRYTADTLKALQNRYPAARFVWLMGADNLVQISRWRAWTQIFNTIPIAVFARDSYDSKALSARASVRFAQARIPERAARLLPDAAPPAWVFLRIKPHPATATDIRQNGAWPAIHEG